MLSTVYKAAKHFLTSVDSKRDVPGYISLMIYGRKLRLEISDGSTLICFQCKNLGKQHHRDALRETLTNIQLGYKEALDLLNIEESERGLS